MRAAYAQPPAHLPTDPTVVHGSATFDTIGDQMNVTNSPNAILDWQSFSIDTGHSVHFQQLNAASQVLNRVTGNDPSQILGNLSSNGGVWLINPHGVLFGQGARIDVGGLVTSTLDISNLDFLAGKFNFNAASGNPGQITNQGEIGTTLGGRVWLIGGKVQNEGMVQTPGGNIVLAAGKSLDLVDSGAPNVIVRITAPDNDVANLGSLVAAAGGSVDLHGSIVNQEGIVRADSVGTDASGRIVFTAAQALTLAENSQTQAAGGNVRMTAGTATYLAGVVDVSRQQGAGGTIQLATDQLEGTAVGGLRADGAQGGAISVEGGDTVAFSSTLSATGSSQGGTIGVTGNSVYLLHAGVDASGGVQGGVVHLGGGWQGGGGMAQAGEVFIGSGSEVKANGGLGSGSGSANTAGRGGEIAVWSTRSSEHYGLLQALNGGRIELSSLGEIHQGGSLQAGPAGSVLLDPKNLIITDNPPDNLTLAKKVIASSIGGGADDQLGFSVSLDGDRLAIGAPGDKDGTQTANTGSVYLFTGAGSDFSGLTLNRKLALNTVEGLQEGEQFGSAVSLTGGLLAVGAPYADNITQFSERGSPTASGAVYIFTGVGTNFSGLTQQTRIDASNGPNLKSDDHFGFAVALDQDRLAIGANGDDTSGTSQGAVYLYTGAGTGGLAEQKKIVFDSALSPLTSQAFFGRAVALNGDRLIVGAPGDDTGGTDRGAAYRYTGVGTNFSGLVAPQKLASSSTNGAEFGISVALDGTRLAVGAPREGIGGTSYLYGGVGPDFTGLTQQKKLDASANIGLASGDQFGYSVSLNGDRLAVGANGDRNSAGAVYLFTGASTIVPSGRGTDNASIATNPSGTSYITPASIVALLDEGTAVTLQANNDITLQSAIITPLSTFGIGNLSFQAGRNITFGANIDTANGNLTAIAGDTGANAAFRDAGTPTLTIDPGVNLNVGPGTATLAAIGGNFINNNGNLAISTSSNPGGAQGRWLIYAADPATSTSGFSQSSYTQRYNQAFAPGSTPAYAASGNWLFYSVATAGVRIPLDPAGTQDTVSTAVQSLNAAVLGAFPVLDWSTTGSLVDLVSMRAPNFGLLNLAHMTREEMEQLIVLRREFKEKIFADAIYKLTLDPSLANVQACPSLVDANSGLCRVTDAQRQEYAKAMQREEPHKSRWKTKVARLPQIERKVIVLFGLDQYTDKTIPPLQNAVFDAEVVGRLFADKLGYEVNVVKNATKTDIVRTLNQLSLEMQPHDSVVIYYAGHGYRDEKTGSGYWVPSDASVSDPTTWVSNSDVSKMLSEISAKQMVMISDSCYSGRFAKEQELGLSVSGITADEVLAKRSVVVMSSGGDEPVADEGKGGHSIFAWDLMQALRNVNNWQPGTSIFEQVKREVMKSFPQTPQYGAVRSAGHEAGGDYLFEFRELEQVP